MEQSKTDNTAAAARMSESDVIRAKINSGELEVGTVYEEPDPTPDPDHMVLRTEKLVKIYGSRKVVDGPSMKDTLQHGDIVLTRRLGYTPRQGDVVVLTKESFRSDSIIKRVIATEGQRVDIDYAANTVTVDGEVLSEPYLPEPMRVPGYGDTVNHLTVPEGCIFVMGDNRNHSSDSRYPDIGVVDVRRLFGMSAIKLEASIDLVINLEAWKDDATYDRLGAENLYTSILDVPVPTLTIPVKPGRNLAVILEVAAINVRQRKLGYNAAQEFTDQVNKHFAALEGNE